MKRLAFGLLVCAGFSAFALSVMCQDEPKREAAPGATVSCPHDKTRSIEDVILSVARRQVHDLADGEYARGDWGAVLASRPPRGVEWVYPWGVTLFGLLRTSEVLGDKELAGFVIQHNEIIARYWKYLSWIQDAHSEARANDVRAFIRRAPALRVTRLDTLDTAGAMSGQMVEAYLRHGAKPTAEQLELLRVTTSHVISRQSRLPDGTFWRPETGETLWIDDLFMGCSLLTRWYEYTKERGPIDDAARQILGMAKRQQDADGLWFHANFIAEKKPSPYKWGRANGWVMVAMVEVLTRLPQDHPDRPAILAILRKQIDGIKPLQAPSGLWRQVLDHEELWEETSCSCMFTFSIARAVRLGLIPPGDLAIARKAFVGIQGRVDKDGVVSGTSEGTLIGRDLAYYANRGHGTDDWHAPGPVLLAGAELLAAERKQ